MDSINKVSLLSQHVWLSLSQDTRRKIAELFGLTKSGQPMVNIGAYGAEVISDGYSVGDFVPITINKMNEILGTESKDFYELFDKIVDKVENPLINILGEDGEKIEGVGEIEKEPFCNFCDSKGGRHKLNCTRPQ
jgi:hypothetical protein